MVFQKQLKAAVVFGLCFSVPAYVGAAIKGVSASQFPCHSVEIEAAPVASFGCLKGGKGSFSAGSNEWLVHARRQECLSSSPHRR